MTAMKHQKKYTELEQVIYNTCFDDELWVVYPWYGAMRKNVFVTQSVTNKTSIE